MESDVKTNEAAPQMQAQASMATEPESGSRALFLIGGIAVLVVFVLGISAWFYLNSHAAAPEKKIVRIGLSLDSVKIQRWSDERDIMTKHAADLGATVTTFSAENDDAKQLAQLQNLIDQKVDVIIVVAHDADAVAPILTKAQEAGIKVIDYDRLTHGGTPDLYLSFDSTKVGEIEAQYVVDAAMKNTKVPDIAFIGGSPTDNNAFLVKDGAMKILDPLEKAGKIKIVYNEFTKDWSQSEAYSSLKKFLDAGNRVDGVVASNDGMGFGAIQALAEHHLDGKVPVSGQDGELQAVQRIVAGTQIVTAWKPGKPLAERAIDAAVDFAEGKEPETNGTVNNKTADIKAYLLDPVAVTKDNIRDTVIKSGTYTEDEIYGSAGQ